MNDHTEKQPIKDNVMKAIETGKVKMLPKWRFVAKTGLIIVGIILAALSLLFIVSFIVYILRQSGAWFAPGFGFRGIRTFFSSLPWLLIAVAALFIIILQLLVKRYAFSYGRPLLYSALGIIILALSGGLIIANSPFHPHLFKQAQEQRLPFGTKFYRQYGLSPSRNILAGTILEIDEKGYHIRVQNGDTMAVIITPETRFPLGADFKSGDRIVVLGERQNGEIKAIGVRKIDQGTPPPPPPRRSPEDPKWQMYR